MSVQVRWTPGAIGDLEEIDAYLRLRSREVAAKIVEKILRRAKSIAIFPRLGPMVHGHDDENLRELLESFYRVIYRIIDDEHIEIITIFHAARQLPDDI